MTTDRASVWCFVILALVLYFGYSIFKLFGG
jgi:small neutral amino acid transporter SnatA (MarC family)